MKELKQYQCEYCHTLYADPKKAEECEAGHHKLTRIREQKFRPISVFSHGFAESVVLESKDGKQALYTFKHLIREGRNVN